MGVEVLAFYFGLKGEKPLTLDEIGIQLDLTRERVRQIKERAIRRLRKNMKMNSTMRSYM